VTEGNPFREMERILRCVKWLGGNEGSWTKWNLNHGVSFLLWSTSLYFTLRASFAIQNRSWRFCGP